jgi:heat-inducible transcriptional repressor
MGPTSSTARKLEILHAIVKAYIETGEPVASRSVARLRRDNLSAASVRNVMADLCDDGYLAQPHTSAGRTPTEKAFRSYIGSLLTNNRVLTAELARVRAELGRMDTMEGRMERSSHMLTEMTHSVGIAAAIPTASQHLDQIELLSLGDKRVLMIVVTKDRTVRQRVVMLDERVAEGELESIRNYVNHNFSGWVLSKVQSELNRRLEQESAAYDAILRKLMVLNDKGLLDIGLSPEVHLEGASNLVGLDLHLTREKMRELFHALEEKKRLLQLLDKFLEHGEGEIAVQVGLGDAHPSMGELSLIGLSVVLPTGMRAKVAVLGPIRMDYTRVLSAVLHVGQALRTSMV